MTRPVLGALSLFALAVAVSACGGSGSETPPPLEPLPINLHYDRASTALAGDQPLIEVDAGAIVRASDPVEEAPDTTPPARSTWGGTKDAPAPSIK